MNSQFLSLTLISNLNFRLTYSSVYLLCHKTSFLIQQRFIYLPILKEISPGISLEGMMLKLKLQYFGHLMQRVDSLEKTLMLRRIGGRRRRGQQDEMAGWHH